MDSLRRAVYNGLTFYVESYKAKKSAIKKYTSGKRASIRPDVQLTSSQKNEIDSFFLKHYGEKVSYGAHRIFYAMTGKFDKKYFPDSLFIPEYEFLLNPKEYHVALSDKNIIPLLFARGGVKTPNSIVSCANGVLRDAQYNLLSEKDATNILENRGKVFLKPTTDSSSGRGCRVLQFAGGKEVQTGETLSQIVNGFNNNFCIQEYIMCHDTVSKLHPQSVNTFRVISYFTPSHEIHHCPVIMRIGSGENYLDNAHAGGMFIGIDDDGNLLDCATTEFNTKFTSHPDTNIVFSGYRIPLVKKVIKASQELHAMIPQLGVINFDFTINDKDEVVLVEINTRGGSIWLPQMAWGCGAFGNDTEEILEFLKEKKKLFPLKWR